MDDDTTQAAQHHADMQAFEQQARDALIASRIRPLTTDEISAISWWAGFGIQDKEVRL